jgi:hypothetical protein
METMTSVSEDGKHIVLGRALPVTGLRTYRAGDLVPVAWKDGVPVAVIGHRWRRAQFHARRVDAAGIVEQLFVADLDEQGNDVWYRNHERLEKISIRDLVPGRDPQAVKWGMDGQSFVVELDDGWYATFSLDRGDPNIAERAGSWEAKQLYLGKPLDSSVPLVTATWVNQITYRIAEFVGRIESWWKYTAHWFSHWIFYSPPLWAYIREYDRGEVTWEADRISAGVAATSGQKSFPLHATLAGSIADYYGLEGLCGGSVLDFWLDANRRLRFLIDAWWDYFAVGTSQMGTGSITWSIPRTRTVQFTVGGGGAMLGAKKHPSLGGATVDERHLFVLDAETESIVWATAAQSATWGSEQNRFAFQIWEHDLDHDPGADETTLPSPHGINKWPARDVDAYYPGAWYAPNTHVLEKSATFDERDKLLSSTGTFQLFDPARLSAIEGPFSEEHPGSHGETRQILGSGYNWMIKYTVQTGSTSRVWHYRVAGAKTFAVRINRGTEDAPEYVDEIRLFLVLERYPFMTGTFYINDLPATWIGVAKVDGTVLTTLRDWQFGLNAMATDLVSGDGHRVIWVLGTGAILPTQTYLITDLDSGEEKTFMTDEIVAWAQKKNKLYPPDFLWDRTEPERFSDPKSLPALEQDDSLTEFSTLLPQGKIPEGSVRMLNDEAILGPLDRYRAI